MDDLWYLVGALVAFAVVINLITGTKPKEPEDQFRRLDLLFSAAERSFLGVLDQACGDRYRVFGKVRGADVLAPAKGLNKSDWTRAFNRIKAKHLDFVICEPSTLQIKAIVELNDKSHKRKSRADRDRFLADVCAQVKLPLLFVDAKRGYTLETIKQLVDGIEPSPLTVNESPNP